MSSTPKSIAVDIETYDNGTITIDTPGVLPKRRVAMLASEQSRSDLLVALAPHAQALRDIVVVFVDADTPIADIREDFVAFSVQGMLDQAEGYRACIAESQSALSHTYRLGHNRGFDDFGAAHKAPTLDTQALHHDSKDKRPGHLKGHGARITSARRPR